MKRPTLDKQPIRVLQAQFEYYTLKVSGRETMLRYSLSLSHLFRIHPDKYKPMDFHKGDIIDFKIIRQQEGATPHQINVDLSVIERFWDWMIEFKDEPLTNIALVPRVRNQYVRRQKNRLTLEEFSRLMSEIHDPRVLEVVRAKMLSQDCEPKLCKASISNKMKDACQRAQVPYVPIRLLPEAVHQAAVALLAPDIPLAA